MRFASILSFVAYIAGIHQNNTFLIYFSSLDK
ncbi:hypothetical protein E2C01_018476 [Portunus trituberculatus]|uniref:Uncharacterized protein n=1 Tax=Portunus trituberculatus TaxID=210409 RepID=A0A5B7DW87_PORTR|nr:hypothetical protein [Portunus trituberculatus]